MWILILIQFQCDSDKTISNKDPKLVYSGEFLIYDGKKFTGILETKLDAVGITRKTPYVDGKMDGTEVEMYSGKKNSAERSFFQGKKIGIHRGWYENGQRRFQYSYKDGELHGDVWEWHHTGTLVTLAKFWNGQLLGKKVWRPDGQIYSNFVMHGNRPVGLPGAKLCWQVRSDTNEKTKSF